MKPIQFPWPRPHWLALLLLVIPVSLSGAADAGGTEKKPKPPAPHTLKRGNLKIKIQLDAIVETSQMDPVKIEPKAWADLTVFDAVAHGTRVRKGDVLLRLDPEKLQEQIDELELDRPGAAVSLELALAEMESLKQTTPARLETATRTRRTADEDFGHFQAYGRSQREKNTRFNLKSAEQRLQNALEELTQLEKMYKADDLTEETEEIILKRQKYAVEAAQLSLDAAKLNVERDLETLIPREFENLKAAKRDQESAFSAAQQSLPKALTKKEFDVEKMKRDQKKAEKRLADLKKDLGRFTVFAPSDGIVYYGACENGRWTTGGGVARKLIPGGKLAANEVFMTIVNPDKIGLRAVVTENQLGDLKTGLKGTASPVLAPERKLPVTLEEIAVIPLPGGGFEAKLSFAQVEQARLMPGHNCKVNFAEVARPAAVLAPKEAVFSEGTQRIVYVLARDGKHEKRTVQTGYSDENETELLDGVSEGDKILLKRPE